MVTFFDDPRLPEPHGYHHAVVSEGPLIHTAGQTWRTVEDGDVQCGDLREQTRASVVNAIKALEGAGGGASGLASLDAFVVGLTQDTVDEAYRGIARAARECGFGPVAITVIGVAALAEPGALVEVRAVGVPVTGDRP